MHSIKKTLDSLLEFTRADFKLYVVDNSSTDGTPEFIEQNYPQLELIRNAGNTGFGAGHNLVMDRLDSKYHVVINPDITVKNDAISALADYLEEHEDIGMLAPKSVSRRAYADPRQARPEDKISFCQPPAQRREAGQAPARIRNARRGLHKAL